MGKQQLVKSTRIFFISILTVGLWGCARTEIIESPKTAFAVESGEPIPSKLVWTTRSSSKAYDYLGQVSVRSWSYSGAVERLLEAGKEIQADAVVDVHYEKVGFLTSMHAFAIKYRK